MYILQQTVCTPLFFLQHKRHKMLPYLHLTSPYSKHCQYQAYQSVFQVRLSFCIYPTHTHQWQFCQMQVWKVRKVDGLHSRECGNLHRLEVRHIHPCIVVPLQRGSIRTHGHIEPLFFADSFSSYLNCGVVFLTLFIYTSLGF